MYSAPCQKLVKTMSLFLQACTHAEDLGAPLVKLDQSTMQNFMSVLP